MIQEHQHLIVKNTTILTTTQYLTANKLAVSLFPHDLKIVAPRLPDFFRWEVRLLPRNGEPIDAIVKVATIHHREGRPIALAWLLRGITERKQASSALGVGILDKLD